MGGVLVGTQPARVWCTTHPVNLSPLQSLDFGAGSTPFGLYNVAVGVERKRAAADLPAYAVAADMRLVTNPPCFDASTAPDGLNTWMCAYLGQFEEYQSFGAAIPFGPVHRLGTAWLEARPPFLAWWVGYGCGCESAIGEGSPGRLQAVLM